MTEACGESLALRAVLYFAMYPAAVVSSVGLARVLDCEPKRISAAMTHARRSRLVTASRSESPGPDGGRPPNVYAAGPLLLAIVQDHAERAPSTFEVMP